MNLIDMVTRKDQNLNFNSKNIHSVINWNKQKLRGYTVKSQSDYILEIHSPFSWFPYSANCTDTGWKIIPLGKVSRNANIVLELLDQDENVLCKNSYVVDSLNTEINLEIPILPNGLDKALIRKLRLYIKGKNGFLSFKKPVAFLAVHNVLNRRALLDQCLGRGVELGPGPHPQVSPSERTEVHFIEQMSPSQWNELYNKGGKYNVDPSLWDLYKIGEAHSIPTQDNTLDFIFSSHVFEHLANPIAHLEHWGNKLKSGGKILAIVPDVGGCKDYVYKPSPIDEILQEWEEGSILPNLKHYERWAKHRAKGQNPESFLKANRSIHCHFYTKENISEVLSYAVEKLGFNHFEVTHSRNHKDFFFTLVK